MKSKDNKIDLEKINWFQINMINEVIKNIYPYLNYPFVEKVNLSDKFTAEEKDLITFLYFENKINQLYNLIIELEKIDNDKSFYFQETSKIRQKIEEAKIRCKVFDDFSQLTIEKIVEKCKSLDFYFYEKGSLFEIIKTSNKMQKFLDIIKEYEEKYDSLTKKESEIRKKIETLIKNDLKFLEFFTYDILQKVLEKIKQL